MVDSGKNSRQILLLSLLVIVIPMTLFPARLGLGLGKVSLLNLALEFLFYGFVVYLFNRNVNLGAIVKFAAVTLFFRVVLGVVFAVTIVGLFEMDFQVALKLGVFSYLPGVIIQAIAAPFIMKEPLKSVYEQTPGRLSGFDPSSQEAQKLMGTTSFVVSKSKGVEGSIIPQQPHKKKDIKPETSLDGRNKAGIATSQDQGNTVQNGFDKATHYIGELASVELACVIDSEGLLMSNFTRNDIIAEDWAPFALIHFQDSSSLLSRTSLDSPVKIDFTLDDKRVIISRDGPLFLMVVANRESEDLLNIRVNQSHEMIRSYLNERYGELPFNKVEKENVSST